ncbi:MAG: 50S ribosomal protein L29 [Candidatus Aminicenantales bacterium]
MKIQALRELADDELVRKETELKDQLFKLRFQHELGQLDNAAKLKIVKKDIARIQTILKDRSRESQE